MTKYKPRIRRVWSTERGVFFWHVPDYPPSVPWVGGVSRENLELYRKAHIFCMNLNDKGA